VVLRYLYEPREKEVWYVGRFEVGCVERSSSSLKMFLFFSYVIKGGLFLLFLVHIHPTKKTPEKKKHLNFLLLLVDTHRFSNKLQSSVEQPINQVIS